MMHCTDWQFKSMLYVHRHMCIYMYIRFIFKGLLQCFNVARVSRSSIGFYNQDVRDECIITVAVASLKKSAIKWNRLVHFNQTSGCISWYHAVTHAVVCPNPYFTKLGYLWWRALCGFVTRFPSLPLMCFLDVTVPHLSEMFSFCLFVWLVPWQLWACPHWHFLPLSGLLPVLQLTLSRQWSLTHRGSYWPLGIKEAEWLSSRGSRR